MDFAEPGGTMKAQRKDGGSVTLAVLAPILAAVIGGLAAIGAAVQIVNLAPDQGSTAVQHSNSDVQYGDQ
jgi:hypothetical protein